MDHEYDAQVEDDGTEKTSEGLDSPPNGPSAAHFREAARLAAARARKALEQGEPQNTTKTTPLAAEDFKKAATRHARSVSGRGKIADMKKPRKSPKAKTTTIAEQGTEADESIAMLDERLHLGARMLRAFESQIERLEEAGAKTTEDSTRFEDSARIEEACARLEEFLARAAQVEERLNALISRAEEIAAGMGNGIEICNAIQAGTQERARAIAELESAQQQRSDALIERTQAILTRMKETLENTEAAELTVKREPPVIEIHARTPLTQSPTPNDTPKAEPHPEDSSQSGGIDEAISGETNEDSDEQFSVGTLSVEPGRACRGTQAP